MVPTSSPSALRDAVARLHRALQLQGRRPAEALVGNLSGGERGRLHLAKTLLAGGNVLLLDEPSNDLDVETLRALEDALLEFAGTIL
jgi:ATPase subunit of ABC transporter with duplicated ATPase domains